jgi:ribokinase
MLDLLTVGDAIIDAFLTIHDADVHCHLDEKACEIAFRLGDKIPLDSCDFQLGGNGANVAVGVSRLSGHTGLMAEIGSDAFATQVLHTLHIENVTLTHIHQTRTRSSFAVGIQSGDDRVLFVKHEKRKHDFDFSKAHAKWLYVTSLGEEWNSAYEKACSCAKESGAQIAFSPGTRQLEAGREELKDILAVSAILFLNRDEAQKLIGREEGSIEKLLGALHALGPKIVVVTDGKNGSYVRDESGSIYSLAICEGPVVEKTGAGDAYASGYIYAHMMGLETTTAMKWGTVNAAAVIGKVGAQTGLLRKDELEDMLRSHKELIAKKL